MSSGEGRGPGRAFEVLADTKALKRYLLSAIALIAGYEAVKAVVIDHVRGFYGLAPQTDVDVPQDDARYSSEVLSRHSSPLAASLDWLLELGAITQSDIDTLQMLRKLRNDLAHGPLSGLDRNVTTEEIDASFQAMLGFLRSFELWWAKEVVIPIDPQFDGQQIADGDIQAGSVVILSLIGEAAKEARP